MRNLRGYRVKLGELALLLLLDFRHRIVTRALCAEMRHMHHIQSGIDVLRKLKRPIYRASASRAAVGR